MMPKMIIAAILFGLLVTYSGGAHAQDHRQRVLITFPISFSKEARGKADTYIPNFFRKGFQKCDSSCTQIGRPVVDEIIIRTAYWIPYVVSEIQKLKPNYSIELAPSALRLDTSGILTYGDDVDPSADIHIDFAVFERDARQGAYSYEPTTLAKRFAPLFVVTMRTPDQKTVWAESGFLNDAGSTSGTVLGDLIAAAEKGASSAKIPQSAIEFKQAKMSGEEWTAFLSESPVAFVQSTKFLERPVGAVVRSIDAISPPVDGAMDDNEYARLLNVNYGDLDPKKKSLIPVMREAEGRYIDEQTRSILRYLHESDEANVTRSMMSSEQQAIDKAIGDAWTMALGGLASGANTLQMYQAMVTSTNANNQAEQAKINAFAPLMSQQVAIIGKDTGESAAVTADSLSSLRQKFRAILIR